jgi:hypothetical protein
MSLRIYYSRFWCVKTTDVWLVEWELIGLFREMIKRFTKVHCIWVLNGDWMRLLKDNRSLMPYFSTLCSWYFWIIRMATIWNLLIFGTCNNNNLWCRSSIFWQWCWWSTNYFSSYSITFILVISREKYNLNIFSLFICFICKFTTLSWGTCCCFIFQQLNLWHLNLKSKSNYKYKLFTVNMVR